MRTALALLCCALAVAPAVGDEGRAPGRDAFHYNRLLGRGINLGNALEAPREGEWGLTLKEEFFPLIRKAGFDSVRVPIRWSAHAQAKPPHRIDPAFFRRIDWVVDQALGNDLVAVINVHHYEELYAGPPAQKARFLALWNQIAERYRDRSDRLFFELLNEPHGKLTDELWNGYLREALKVVRASNPKRAVVVGPGSWNNPQHLRRLDLPADDRLLIVTFHYYSPFEFTHQGAEWARDSKKWLGRRWQGMREEKRQVVKDLGVAAEWAKKEKRPLFLGEFGAYRRADMDSRARWTAFVREEAERRGMSWAYWELAAGFGAYDRGARRWHQPLLSALISRLDETPSR
jgi:endoglucanase